MAEDLQDPSGADAPDVDTAYADPSDLGVPSPPQPSPAGFWDRSTWDPDTLGAAASGQPTAPYRPSSQVQA